MLTTREEQIADLLSKGYSNKKIKGALGIELSTVEWHLRQMYQKYKVSDRVNFILIYLQRTHA